MAVYKFILSLSFFLIGFISAHAQLDTMHWIPPMAPDPVTHGYQDQYFYITTPEEEPFQVDLKDNRGKIIKSFNVSKNHPIDFHIEQKYNYDSLSLVLIKKTLLKIVAGNVEVNTVHNDRGLIFEGENPFMLNYRVKEPFHAGSYIAKGNKAKGTEFRLGHILSSASQNRHHFFSLMTTEDSTLISLEDYEYGLKPIGYLSALDSTFSILIEEKGSSYSMCLKSLGVNINGLIGAKLSSNKPIVVNCGSWSSSNSFSAKQDIEIDQILPASLMTDEYVAIKGNGSSAQEVIIVVSHYPNTHIYLNNDSVETATLKPGEHHIVTGSSYSANNSLYVRASNPVYLYKTVAGLKDDEATGDMCLIQPFNTDAAECSRIDISKVNTVGTDLYSGTLTILASKGEEIQINKDTLSMSMAQNVIGSLDKVLYTLPNFQGDLTIESSAPFQVEYTGHLNHAGYQSLFSSYKNLYLKSPTATMRQTPGYLCNDGDLLTYTLTTENQGLSPNFEWFVDGVLQKETQGPSFSSSQLSHGSTVYCLMYSSEQCVEPNPIASDTMIVKGFMQTPEIFCYNGVLEIPAAPPKTKYQWYSSDSLISDAPTIDCQEGNISAILTSEDGCIVNSSKKSFNCGSDCVFREEGEIVDYYPNPASGVITIEYKGYPYKEFKVLLHDGRGRLIKKHDNVRSAKNGRFSTTVNTSNLADGVYFIILRDLQNNNSHSHRIMVDSN